MNPCPIHQAGKQSPDAEQLFLLIESAAFHKRFVPDIGLPGSI